MRRRIRYRTGVPVRDNDSAIRRARIRSREFAEIVPPALFFFLSLYDPHSPRCISQTNGSHPARYREQYSFANADQELAADNPAVI